MARRMSGESLPPPAYASTGLSAIILKACAYNPAKRYQNAGEMRAALEAYAAGGVVEAAQSSIASTIAPEPVLWANPAPDKNHVFDATQGIFSPTDDKTIADQDVTVVSETFNRQIEQDEERKRKELEKQRQEQRLRDEQRKEQRSREQQHEEQRLREEQRNKESVSNISNVTPATSLEQLLKPNKNRKRLMTIAAVVIFVFAVRMSGRPSNNVRGTIGKPQIVSHGVDGDYKYYIYDNGVERYAVMSEYVGSSAQVSVPDSLGVFLARKPVREIGAHAFHQKTFVHSISIPDSVIVIRNRAFNGCESLTDVNVPDGVRSIGEGAFAHCYSLTSINIPDSVTVIEKKAFDQCKALTSIHLPAGITSIDDSAFYYCKSLTSINFPNGITSIGYSAFTGCDSLNTIVLPDSVTTIGESAFSACYSLVSIKIPSGVRQIGNFAFPHNATLQVSPGSYAEQYAKENRRSYTYIK